METAEEEEHLISFTGGSSTANLEEIGSVEAQRRRRGKRFGSRRKFRSSSSSPLPDSRSATSSSGGARRRRKRDAAMWREEGIERSDLEGSAVSGGDDRVKKSAGEEWCNERRG
ncbi:hypothetical protein PIB30_055330 [Stylosanthes scabra]|uniref:Uncharacterized protein n=1 Tax=Stylosanthes scabra TaxID=79078 RepID=A0ABU6TJP3_9FABA|nr:hypothetical protein [Stylosanthes scabra]